MTHRNFPDFVMASRFFHSADIAELEDALTWEQREPQDPEGSRTHAFPSASGGDDGNSNTCGDVIFLRPTSSKNA